MMRKAPSHILQKPSSTAQASPPNTTPVKVDDLGARREVRCVPRARFSPSPGGSAPPVWHETSLFTLLFAK